MVAAQAKLFFVVGVGRSGTTLLQSMLNAHPKIALPPESHFIKKYIVPELNGRMQPETPEDLYDRLRQDKHLARLRLDLQAIITSINTDGKQISYTELFPHILKAYARGVHKNIIGDKDPSYTYHLKEIHAAYPDAIVIHIIRDPRDVVLSRIKSEWGRKMGFWYHVMEYRRAVQSSKKIGPLLFGSNYMELFYEDLIRQPQKELDSICGKLGVSYHPSMLDYHKSAGEIVCREEIQWKENVFKPIAKNNTQKWMKRLKRWQVLTIEGACADLMRRFDYPFSDVSRIWNRKLLALPVYAYLWGAAAKTTMRNFCKLLFV